MSYLSGVVDEFFREDEWPITTDDDPARRDVTFEGTNGRWECRAWILDDDEEFLFFSIAPVAVIEQHRAAMAEFITRANFGLVLGNFEMNYGTGELRYKTSIGVQGAVLSTALVKQVVYANVAVMDKYLPGIMLVASGRVAPEAAIADIESEP